MQLNVKNETSTLKAVVLGQPGSIGKVPTLEETGQRIFRVGKLSFKRIA